MKHVIAFNEVVKATPDATLTILFITQEENDLFSVKKRVSNVSYTDTKESTMYRDLGSFKDALVLLAMEMKTGTEYTQVIL